jgi:hypothetical protein
MNKSQMKELPKLSELSRSRQLVFVVVVVFTYQIFFHHVDSIFMLFRRLRLRFRNEFVFGQSATLHTEKLNWTRIWASRYSSPVKISSWF